jgi:hypothetical protein
LYNIQTPLKKNEKEDAMGHNTVPRSDAAKNDLIVTLPIKHRPYWEQLDNVKNSKQQNNECPLIRI